MIDRNLGAAMIARTPLVDAAGLYREGVIGGLIGAAAIAVWFFVVDLITGRPLFTPTVLGTALFRREELLTHSTTLPASAAMVVMFTFVHAVVFMVLGALASRLLGLAERNPNLGFGIIILFVVFMFGFVGWAMLFAEPVLKALTLPAILVGNLLAAGAMAGYFRRRHPSLRILP